MSDLPTIWALKIQPNSADEDAVPYEFCKNHDPPIIGTGWGLDFQPESAEEALHEFQERWTDQHGRVPFSLRAMVEKSEVDDFVWVNEGSEYALCRIESDWNHHPASDPDEWTRNDIHNYRRATWKIVPHELVPGYVKRYFANPRSRTMSEPQDGKTEEAKDYCRRLFESSAEITDIDNLETIHQLVETAPLSRVFSLLDPNDTEDVVISYLQSNGWYVIKSSTSQAQAGIECVLRRGNGKAETAYVQVKSGDATVNIDRLKDFTESGTVFVHQSEVPDTLPDEVVGITQSELRNYIANHAGYLPRHVLIKLHHGLNNG